MVHKLAFVDAHAFLTVSEDATVRQYDIRAPAPTGDQYPGPACIIHLSDAQATFYVLKKLTF